MGVVEEILKNKEEIIIKLLQVIEGKEVSTRVKLDGIKLNIGDSVVKLNGAIEFTLIPSKGKK